MLQSTVETKGAAVAVVLTVLMVAATAVVAAAAAKRLTSEGQRPFPFHIKGDGLFIVILVAYQNGQKLLYCDSFFQVDRIFLVYWEKSYFMLFLQGFRKFLSYEQSNKILVQNHKLLLHNLEFLYTLP